MASFHSMLPEEVEAITRLPFLVGVWMSHVDDEDGSRDDEREHRALHAILKYIADDRSISPFIADVAGEALAYAHVHTDWEKLHIHKMPEPSGALQIVSAHAGADDARSYRKLVYRVALTVARAHGEFGAEDEAQGGIAGLMGRILDKIRDDDMSAPENVSAAEHDALEALRAALKA